MRTYTRLFIFAALITSTRAHAEPADKPADNKALVEQGLKLRREHRDVEALDVFRRAHDAHPSPRTRAQIALAEQALGHWVDAERDLRAALSATEDPWIASHQQALRGALETIEKHLATLVVKTNAPAAEIWLNGVLAKSLPNEPVRLPAGEARLELRAKGHTPVQRSIELAPAATVIAEIPMTAVPEPTPPPTASPVSDRLALKADPTLAAVDDADARRAGGTPRAFAWAALGGAGAFLGAAVVAQLVREEKASTYNDDSRCLFGDLSRDQRCGVYRGQAESAQTFANVGYIAAGSLGLASAILFLASPAKSKATGMAFSLQVGASKAEFTVAGKL